jgi:hypothetical protein
MKVNRKKKNLIKKEIKINKFENEVVIFFKLSLEWSTDSCLKRKVFIKNQKHQPNIVEITHLCIMHRVHTSRKNSTKKKNPPYTSSNYSSLEFSDSFFFNLSLLVPFSLSLGWLNLITHFLLCPPTLSGTFFLVTGLAEPHNSLSSLSTLSDELAPTVIIVPW